VTGPARPASWIVTDEPDQVRRLERFRVAHPGVVIGEVIRGCWQAWIPEPAGGTVVTRYSLRELLDRLAELLGGADDH
jgi:hypothetical protein